MLVLLDLLFHNSSEFCTRSCVILAVYNKLLLYKCKSCMYCIFLEVVLHVSVQLKFCQLCYIIIIAHSKRLCELQGFFICNLMQNILHVHLVWPGLHMFAMIEHF